MSPQIQMLMDAAVRKPGSPELLYSSSQASENQHLLCLVWVCLMSLMYAFTPTMRLALPCQYCMNREKYIELLWHLCGRVLGGCRRREETVKSRAMPQRGLCCSDRGRKGQEKKGFTGTKKTVDMKEAREQKRGTWTKDGKAWSRDLRLIREMQLNERLRHPPTPSLPPAPHLLSLHSLGSICCVNKGFRPASIPSSLWLITGKW